MVSRNFTDVVLTLMRDEPVVLVQGPCSVGKTTLMLQLAKKLRAEVVDLDDLATRDAARADPALFVSGDPPVCIDESWRVAASRGGPLPLGWPTGRVARVLRRAWQVGIAMRRLRRQRRPEGMPWRVLWRRRLRRWRLRQVVVIRGRQSSTGP